MDLFALLEIMILIYMFQVEKQYGLRALTLSGSGFKSLFCHLQDGYLTSVSLNFQIWKMGLR